MMLPDNKDQAATLKYHRMIDNLVDKTHWNIFRGLVDFGEAEDTDKLQTVQISDEELKKG